MSSLVALFYYIGNSINVYKFALPGALFEMLSVAMVLAYSVFLLFRLFHW